MCFECAELNYAKRFQSADLSGQVALITGSRLKIGYHCTLMMLRAGAKVIATTRFPKDSAVRFSKEKDFEKWQHNLQIYGLDLRHTPSVEIFARHIEKEYSRLDILINNAAQTVRRPPGFYAHLMELENSSIEKLPLLAQSVLSEHQRFTGQLAQLDHDSLADEKALPVAWHGASPGVGIHSSAQLSQVPYSYDQSLSVAQVFPQCRTYKDL